jgi:hypothetical protein
LVVALGAGASAAVADQSEPWLGTVYNSALSWDGGLEVLSAHGILFDRGGWNSTEGAGQGIEFEAGEKPVPGDDLEESVDAGMIPVVSVDYDGAIEHGWGSDPSFPHSEAQIEAYVEGFIETVGAIRAAFPGKQILFEVMSEPWANTTPEANGAEYAAVVARVLPAAEEAGIPLEDVYVQATGSDLNDAEEWQAGWIPAMYESEPALEGEIQGWATEPYGPPSGIINDDNGGIEALPSLRQQMTSGQGNLLVSAIGFCARNVGEGVGCYEGPETTETGQEAAKDLETVLSTALAYHGEGWLHALIVYVRGYGGWSLQLENGELTAQGEALERFAESHDGIVPQIGSISSDNGPAEGGKQVTITGSGFTEHTTTVKFGNTKATNVDVESTTQITARSPEGTGTVDITVSNPNGASTPSAQDLFAYVPSRTGPWLGTVYNSALSWDGGIEVFSSHGIVFDRGAWNSTEGAGQGIEFEAGEKPAPGDDLEESLGAGMVPMVSVDYDGAIEHGWGSDPDFPQSEAQISAYVEGFLETVTTIREAYPGKQVLFEIMSEPAANTTPEENGAEYAHVVAQVLPAAKAAGIPLEDLYVHGGGSDMNSAEEWQAGWIPAMYEAEPSLESEIRGWALEPYGPPTGIFNDDNGGIEALPALRTQMSSGENNLLVSAIGFCARNVSEGLGCYEGPEALNTGDEAAKDLETILNTALKYHEEGWLRALIIYVRGYGGWSLQLENEELTKQGEALIAFAEQHSPPIPIVTSISPGSGPVEGGTQVTITGSGFIHEDTVTFGQAEANGVEVESPTQITATSPEGTGTVDVTVSDTGGASAHKAGDHFEYTGETPTNTEAPSIQGALQDGQTLIAEPGSWSGPGPITYAYQWQSCNAKGSECEDIEGATTRTDTLSASDLEASVRVVVTATNGQGATRAESATSEEVVEGPPGEVEAPTVDGLARVGEPLLGEPGQWGGAETVLRYQWERCNAAGGACAAIPGATGNEYVPATGDEGDALRLRVGASNGFAATTAVSAATPVIGEAAQTLEETSPPRLEGAAVVGQVLSVSNGTWLGEQPITFAYQWEGCDPLSGECEAIAGARGSSYTLIKVDEGQLVRAVVTVTDANGVASRAATTGQPVAPEGGPVDQEGPLIAGFPAVSQTLYAMPGASSASSTLSYQWERCDEDGLYCDPVEGAEASSYTPVTADAGSTLRVAISAEGPANSGTAVSTQTATVVPAAPSKIIAPSISGSDQAANPLNADPGIWIAESAISYSYEWSICDAAGEECVASTEGSKATYTPSSTDIGKAARVTITASDVSGEGGPDAASGGIIEAESGTPLNTTAPLLEGSATVGESLMVTQGAWTGEQPISYSYEWMRCNEDGEECSAIGGANEASYIPTEADLGSALRAEVTATNTDGSAEAASSLSEAIDAAGPPSLDGEEPAITGEAQAGQPVYAQTGQWTGTRPMTFHYQWRLCDTAGENCTTIEGATTPRYTIPSIDANKTLTVTISPTNTLGTASATSHAVAVAAEGEAATSTAIELAEEANPSILAPAEPIELEEETVAPTIANEEELIEAKSTLTSSIVSTETPGEFEINTPIGDISLRMTGTSPNATTTPTIVNGAVAAYAETYPETDTFVRPTPTGTMTLLQLRSETAPTSFSWELGLTGEQELQELSDGAIAIVEPGAEPLLEGEPPGEALGGGESQPAEEPTGEDLDEEEASTVEEDEAGEEILTPLPPAPETTTPEITPAPGELHPQDTASTYTQAANTLEYAESQAPGTILFVIDPPTAIDSNGNSVPVTIKADGDTITATMAPTNATDYPASLGISVAAPTNVASTAKAAHKHRYGLVDIHTNGFTESIVPGHTTEFDPNLTAGPHAVERARLILNWNTSPTNTRLVQWLKDVTKDGLKPYITIDKCESEEQPEYSRKWTTCPAKAVPSLAQYREHVKNLMKKLSETGKGYAPVLYWGAWNEPNEEELATAEMGGATKAAHMWVDAQKIAEDVCPHRCKIIAGELAGYAGEHVSFLAKYDKAIKAIERNHRDTAKPVIWGLHDYGDMTKVALGAEANNRGEEGFLRKTRQEFRSLGHKDLHFWISEAGVLLVLPEGLQPLAKRRAAQFRAARDYIRLADASGVDWAYYYQYREPLEPDQAEKEQELNGTEKRITYRFDSALTNYGQQEPDDRRPAYCVIVEGHNGCSPHVKTGSAVAGAISSRTVQVSAEVSPEGASTSYWVEYGATGSYGQTSKTMSVEPGDELQSARVSLSNLDACTEYHYRAAAENEAGVSYGQDETVSTECGGDAVISVAAGINHTCKLLATGHVECWGDNAEGQLGDGTTVASESPVEVDGISEAVAITAGGEYSCAVLASGHIDCWGSNFDGQLGNGGTTASTTPVRVLGIEDAVSVTAAGWWHACGITTGASMTCWGADEVGQGAELVEGLTGPVASAGGGVAVTCALLVSGEVECWGENPAGLGDGSTTESKEPVKVANIASATSISSGGDGFVCATLSGGHVECWGYNEFGELGDGSTTNRSTPVRVVGLGDAVEVSAGAVFACARKQTGEVDCWGDNEFGELGDGGDTSSDTPVPVEEVSDATAISASGRHVCIVLGGSSVRCWGALEEEEEDGVPD